MKYIYLTILLSFSIHSFAKIEFNANCQYAYKEMMKMELKNASTILTKEEVKNPHNLIPSFIRNYSSFLRIVIEEDSRNYDKFIEDTKEIIDDFENETDDSPYKKYCITDLYLEMAYINALQESYFSAALKLRSARNNILKNHKDFPDFLPNKKALGMMNVTLGSVPENYGWILDVFGLEGSVNKGLYILKDLLIQTENSKKYAWLSTEALLGYSFSLINFGDSKNHNDFLRNIFQQKIEDSTISHNQLLSYSASSFYRHLGDNELVIKVLSSIVLNPNTQKIYYLDYLLGSAYLYKMEYKSLKLFSQYLKEFQGKAYKKSALQKIAWHYLIMGNSKNYKLFMERIKTEGAAFFDSDKQAMKNAENGYNPNVYLLKSRLLFDGGYYKEAARIFTINNPVRVLKTKRDFLEFNYRMGRIYDEWGETFKAMEYYQKTINMGKDFPYYYAANASLHLGYIFEKQGKFKQASKSYQLCLDLTFTEYHNSITQKAKAGLNRVK